MPSVARKARAGALPVLQGTRRSRRSRKYFFSTNIGLRNKKKVHSETQLALVLD
jgi:hypothetical protein